MTDAWDGRPKNPERGGWHWLRRADGFAAPYRWTPGNRDPMNGFWLYPPDWELMPEDHEILRQTYLGPCLTPQEVASREKAAYQHGWNDREGDLLAGIDRVYGTENPNAE